MRKWLLITGYPIVIAGLLIGLFTDVPVLTIFNIFMSGYITRSLVDLHKEPALA